MIKLPCPPELWPRFSALLDDALDLPPEQRVAWLESLDAGDAPLVPWLRGVLEVPDGVTTSDFLRPGLPLMPLAADEPRAATAGQRVGPWRLERELGSGGMGTVWLASRDDGVYRREVALKLPHAHLLAGAVGARFARERNILAGLAHPHIARFYDAGLAEDGQPWLALEYVDGRPLTTYCDEEGLDVRDRAALLRQVALAVQAAHARLIVHRDLKPANVLVTPDGTVKLLDFGIAKLLDDEAEGATQFTALGSGVATPAYAAPEQLAGGAITVGTDVYALGVMLYELLTGQLPFSAPSRLGRLVTARGEAPLASTRVEGTRRRTVRGDLDSIVAKTLEAEATRRYASAEALAADLARYLAHEPTVAVRLTLARRTWKFARRHWRALAVAVLLLLMLTAGLTGILWQSHEARTQAHRAEAVKDFLVDVYSASDPRIAQDKPRGQITAKELLDLSADKIEERFANQPDLQIELLRTAAEIYGQLGEDARYEALQARHLELARRLRGPLDPAVIAGAVEAGERAAVRADWATCTRLQAEADALLRRAGMDRSLSRARWWTTEYLRARADPDPGAAERARTAVMEALRLNQALAPGQRAHVTALSNVADYLLVIDGDIFGAIDRNREALALAERLPDRDDAELGMLYGNLGVSLQQVGRLREAGEAFQRSAAIAERTTGHDHIGAQYMRAQGARTLHLAGERDRALALFRTVDPVIDSPRTDSDASIIRLMYGAALSAEGRPQAAIPLLRRAERDLAVESNGETLGALVRMALAAALGRAGRHEEARAQLDAALDDYVARKPRWDGYAVRLAWGRFLLQQGEFDAAAEQFRGYIVEAPPHSGPSLALAQGELSAAALAGGDVPQALDLSAKALQAWEADAGFHDVRWEPLLQRRRADALAAAGRLAEAQKLEDAAWAASERYDAPESPTRIHRRMVAPNGSRVGP